MTALVDRYVDMVRYMVGYDYREEDRDAGVCVALTAGTATAAFVVAIGVASAVTDLTLKYWNDESLGISLALGLAVGLTAGGITACALPAIFCACGCPRSPRRDYQQV